MTRCPRCRRAASPSRRSPSPPRRWSARSAGSARTSSRRTTRTAATPTPTTSCATTCRWRPSSRPATRTRSRTPGPAWQPLKVYYNQTFSRARIEAFHEALTALGEESPYAEWLENWSRPDRAVTTRVECAAWFEQRDAALLAHATQVDPDGTWFRVSREVQAQVWPTEDYEAALSFIPIVEGEDDLFAGIPTDLAAADALATSGGLTVALDTRTEREA